jgi:hypothetical protein
LDRTYRLSAAAWAAEARRVGRRALALALAAALAVVGAWAAVLRDRGAGPGTLVLPLGALAVLAWLSHRARMRRSRARWEGFRLVLEDGGIRRELPGFPTVAIPRGEVAAVDEGPRGIAVRARDRALLVPVQLEGFAEVRAALAAWRPGA